MKKFYLLFIATIFSMSMGAQTLVLDEKFDAFTNGSVEAPGTVDITGYSSTIEHRLANILTGWRGSQVYEAGGALHIKDGGNLQTAYLNTNSDGANARLTVDVKMRDSYGGGIQLYFGYSSVGVIILNDDQWHTVEFYLTGSSYQYFKIQPYLSASGLIIDNMKVETDPSFIAPPTVYQPTTASKTSFVASWKRVTGMDGYKVSVFSYNAQKEREYFEQDRVVGASYSTSTFTGLDATKTYFYTVKCVKGENTSKESEEVEVVPVYSSLDAPVALDATNITESGFTANWAAAENADLYTVTVTRNETLTEAQEVKILDEDFSGVTKGTFPSVDYPASREYLDAYTKVPGWYGIGHALSAGYMVIAPFSGSGTVTTPALDLSANGGKFGFDIKVAGNYYGTFKEDVCTINIYKGEEETPVHTFDINTSATGFQNFHYDLECGDKDMKIEILYSGSNKLFIDELSVSQELGAGTVITSVAEKKENITELSCDFALPFSENVNYSYCVMASVRTVISGEIDYLSSAASNSITVERPTAVGSIESEKELEAESGKLMKDGRLVIQKGSLRFNAMGQRIK